MNGARSSHKRATNRFHYQQPRDFHVALWFAALLLLLHTYAQVAEFRKAAEFTALTSSTIPFLFLLIEIGLLANVVGLWLRKAAGILISITALLVVCGGYAAWYGYSRQILNALSSKSFYLSYPEAVPTHHFGLIGATLVNIIVLAMTGVLLVWELKTLRGMLKPRRS